MEASIRLLQECLGVFEEVRLVVDVEDPDGAGSGRWSWLYHGRQIEFP